MIAGFAVTAAIAGKLLDPYSGTRLILVTAAVSLSALSIACIAIWRVEGHHALSPTPALQSRWMPMQRSRPRQQASPPSVA